MPMTHNNTRTFHRLLFAGMNEAVTLYKRGDDLQEGTITGYVLFQCRRSLITKGGEPIINGTQDDHRCIWHIPRIELDRIGIAYINPADYFVDKVNRFWQPEATTEIFVKLMENHIDVMCLRIDPFPAPGVIVYA